MLAEKNNKIKDLESELAQKEEINALQKEIVRHYACSCTGEVFSPISILCIDFDIVVVICMTNFFLLLIAVYILS